MLSIIIAVAGALCGIAGVVLGGFAHLRSRTAVDDCRAVVQRLLPDSKGVDVRAVRDVAVVRYDALEEMSGARSFSLALLNAVGDGVVITSINGRTESRTYAKAVEGGNATEVLSPEEYRAVRAARLGQNPAEKSKGEAEKGSRIASGPLTPAVQAPERADGSSGPQVSVIPPQSTNVRESYGPMPGATDGMPGDRPDGHLDRVPSGVSADAGGAAEGQSGESRMRESSEAAKG